jgi:hypothetical protein
MKRLERKEMKTVKGGIAVAAGGACRKENESCNNAKNLCCSGLMCDACQFGGINCVCAP